MGTLTMTLGERIVNWLDAHPGEPQSISEIANALPEATRSGIVGACILLNRQGVLGRNGAGTATKPYRYYVKRKQS